MGEGRKNPSGAARTLLKIAGTNPKALLAVADDWRREGAEFRNSRFPKTVGGQWFQRADDLRGAWNGLLRVMSLVSALPSQANAHIASRELLHFADTHFFEE